MRCHIFTLFYVVISLICFRYRYRHRLFLNLLTRYTRRITAGIRHGYVAWIPTMNGYGDD